MLASMLFFGLVGCRQAQVSGTVIDYDSGDPVPEAVVAVMESGWNFSEMVWDKTYYTLGKTDRSGAFRIDFTSPVPALFFGSNKDVRVIVSHEGYKGFYRNVGKGSFAELKPKARAKGRVSLPLQLFRLGMDQGSPYGWIFADNDITFAEEQADLFPVFPESFTDLDRGEKSFALKAAYGGGIRLVAAESFGGQRELLAYTDVAPEEGCLPLVNISLDQEGGVYFVRTADGSFAKFELRPSFSMTTGGSEEENRQGVWAVYVNGVYNPDGNRDLYYEPASYEIPSSAR